MPQKDNIIMRKAEAYGDRIVRMYQYLTTVRHEHIFSKQIVRSGTSIGANVAESRNAQGPKDFVSKMSIALKEADETEYWLRRLCNGGYITTSQYESMHQDNEEIVSILTSIIKTMKKRFN